MSELNDKALIIKSNKIIEARYKLNPIETKIIMILISLIEPNDCDFKGFKLKVKDVANLIGIESTNKYSRLKSVTGKLVGKKITIQEEDGLLQATWLSSTKYYDNDGMIKFSFDPLLKPYLLELKGNFTSYLLRNILSLENEYSPRIYGLLKQYEKIGKRKIKLYDLRIILGIKDSQYKLYGDFKRYVLKVSQKDIERNTDINFEFKEIKTGRKVTSIVFIIRPNKIAIKDNNKEIFDNLKSIGLKNKDVNLILKDHKLEVIQKVIDNYYSQSDEKLKSIENPAGYFLTMLPEPGEDYQLSKASLKKKEVEKVLEKKRTEDNNNKLIDELKIDFYKFKDTKREKIIKNLSDNEHEALKKEFLDNTSNFVKNFYVKNGFNSIPVQTSYVVFLNKKFLKPDELDFVKYAQSKGYKIKINNYDKYEIIE